MSADAIYCQVYSISDIKIIIKKQIRSIWQNNWETSSIKLNEIKNHTFQWLKNTFTRKEEVIIKKLRIGHTILTCFSKKERRSFHMPNLQLSSNG